MKIRTRKAFKWLKRQWKKCEVVDKTRRIIKTNRKRQLIQIASARRRRRLIWIKRKWAADNDVKLLISAVWFQNFGQQKAKKSH